MKAKRAFTLVELMAVIAIIGILMGIVTTAAASSIKQSRLQKTSALCAIAKQGLETFRMQKDYWPGTIGARIKSGAVLQRANQDGTNNQTDYDRYVLDGTEVRSMFQDIVNETVRNGNPMLDISGLYVSRDSGEIRRRGYGMDFREAVRGTKKSPKKMSIAEMYYGYPEPNHGYFRRFNVVYIVPTDSIEIGRQDRDTE
jgi:prepilin-type N-terminal cleavage/methylation domain-containing protein